MEDAASAMILIHGRGADANSILELGRLLRTDDMICVAPQAANFTWYPNAFIAPLRSNEPWLSSALRVLGERVVELEEAGISRDRIVLAGFSQGACLASEFTARNPGRWGGLLVFSGGLIGPLGMDVRKEGDLEGTPVFMGCSDRDPHIPLERFRESGDTLTAMGAEVDLRVYPGMGHTIIEDELEAAKAVVDQLA
jgi:predicted esterase